MSKKQQETLESKIKAIIFDLDGTLVDSEPNYYEGDKKLLEEYGIELTEDMKSKYTGIGSQDMMEDIKKKFNINDSVEKLVAKKNKYYIEIAKDNTIVFPEMLNFLQLLKKNNFPMAIASGSSPEIIEMIISITNIKSYFDVTLSAEEVKKGKPAPDIFLETAKRLGISPINCLVLEDSQYGVEAAKSAGMYCISIPFPTSQQLHSSFTKADLLYRNGIEDFSAAQAFEWLKKI
ncbi:HAD family hydrolase [Pelosinus sp. sgz500959]|uniref:HAD family hydrolase n=1 Tax=Pelosinus sp. sgz500959 TaxID=3242472 RepID=UPI0036732F59